MLTPIRDALSPHPDQPVTWLAIVMALTTAAVLTGAIATLGQGSHARCHTVDRTSSPDVDRFAEQTARYTIEGYDFVAYPSWAAVNPDQQCPGGLAELGEYFSRADTLGTIDPWSKSYQFLCGHGIHGIRTRSAGPDGVFDTADDIARAP